MKKSEFADAVFGIVSVSIDKALIKYDTIKM